MFLFISVLMRILQSGIYLTLVSGFIFPTNTKPGGKVACCGDFLALMSSTASPILVSHIVERFFFSASAALTPGRRR
jgi:hypothetical protein